MQGGEGYEMSTSGYVVTAVLYNVVFIIVKSFLGFEATVLVALGIIVAEIHKNRKPA